MDPDTGAEVSVLPESIYRSLFPQKQLAKSTVVLKTYTGKSIPVCGEIEVGIQYNSQNLIARLVVVSTDGPALLGRDLLRKIKIDWSTVNQLSDTKAVGVLEMVCHSDQASPIVTG